jgi:hypothetical protein
MLPSARRKEISDLDQSTISLKKHKSRRKPPAFVLSLSKKSVDFFDRPRDRLMAETVPFISGSGELHLEFQAQSQQRGVL